MLLECILEILDTKVEIRDSKYLSHFSISSRSMAGFRSLWIKEGEFFKRPNYPNPAHLTHLHSPFSSPSLPSLNTMG